MGNRHCGLESCSKSIIYPAIDETMELLQLTEISMPYRYLGDLRALDQHPLYGRGECVDLIKALVPGLIGVSTQEWRKGAYVKETPGLLRGTAIATFDPDGRFAHADTGQHAMIFVAHAGAGMWVLEQYKKSGVVLFRHMPVPKTSAQRADGSWPHRSRNPLAFSVIE